MADGDEIRGITRVPAHLPVPRGPHAQAPGLPENELPPMPALAAQADLDRLLLAGLLDSEPSYLFFKDLDGRYLRVSRMMAFAMGLDDPSQAIGHRREDFFPDDGRGSDDRTVIATGVPIVELQERMRIPGDEHRWALTSRYPVRGHAGEVIAVLGIMRDITVRKLMEQQLEDHAQQLLDANAELERVQRELSEILRTSPDPTLRFDEHLRIRFANPAALELIGRAEADVLGRTLEDLGEPPGLDALALSRCLAGRQDVEYETSVQLPSGRTAYLHARLVPERGPNAYEGARADGDDATGAICGVLLVGRDLTDRKRAEDLLADRALRDPLTGLANRVLLADRLQQALLRQHREPEALAVLYLDLDRFKQVNDRHGLRVGDAVLVEIARRLQTAARRGSTVARVGGDAFVVLCERIAGDTEASMLADRVLRAVSRPIDVGGAVVEVSASIGIRVVAEAGSAQGQPETVDALLRDADDALAEAKQRGAGRGSFQLFDPHQREQLVARRTVEAELNEALVGGQFHLAYQPLVSLTDNRLVGTEALLRWSHPDKGPVSPADFVPIAEDSGQIVAIGAWVLDEALRQVAEWNARRHGPPLTMAVNLSARQLSHPTLVEDVAAALARHGVPPRQLCLEVTETALLEEAGATIEVFNRLSGLGVLLALDDFGTGFSSLVHLRRFPVDVLKIDRQFVSGLDGASGDDAIVAAVTAMAHALGMVTVAEGIETPAQLAELIRMGCDEGQGYLLARPVPPAVLEADALFRSGEDGEPERGGPAAPPDGVRRGAS